MEKTKNITYIRINSLEEIGVNSIKILAIFFLFSWGNILVAQNWNYTYPTGINKASVSGIVPIGKDGDYIIQSTDGTVSKIDESGDIVWTLNERDLTFSQWDSDLMQESVAVIGKSILAIHGHQWKLIMDFGGSANVVKRQGWGFDGLEYKGTPVRVKVINEKFIVCGGLHRQANIGDSSGGIFRDFLMQVDTDGDVLWQRTYSNTSSMGSVLEGVNLITDVELWQEDKLIFVKSVMNVSPGFIDGGSVSTVNFSDGSIITQSHIAVQVDPSDPTFLKNFGSGGGFWDIEVDGDKARMIGFIRDQQSLNWPHRALFCTYHLTSNTILGLRKWEVPDKKLVLSKMQKIGGSIFAESPEYVVSATVFNDVESGYTNDHVIISCDKSGSIFNSAFSVDNTKLELNAFTSYPRSSTFYTNTGHLPSLGGVFILGSRTADNELPLVKKSASLSTLGCKTDIQINSVPWAGAVTGTWVTESEPISDVIKIKNIDLGAIRLVECVG